MNFHIVYIVLYAIYLFIICLSLFISYSFVLVIHCCHSFILFIVLLFAPLFNFVLLSLFSDKRFNSDPGLYSRCFDPADQQLYLVPVQVHHHLCKSINIIQQTAPTLS